MKDGMADSKESGREVKRQEEDGQNEDEEIRVEEGQSQGGR